MSLDLKPLNVSSPSRPEELLLRAESERAKRKMYGYLLLGSVFVLFFSLPWPFLGNATMSTSANVSSVISYNCSFPLYSGINYISFNCVSNAQDLDEVLNNTDLTTVDAVYDYRPAGGDSWKVYAPNLPSYVVQDLETVSRLKGYIVVMNDDSAVFFEGFLAGSTDIPLVSGWNLAGYPSLIQDVLPDALTTISGTFEIIRTYNQSQGTIQFNSSFDGALTNLTPNEGYWISMGSSDIWTVSKNRTG